MSDYEVVGIDVSKWQGTMNWEIAKPKIHFAFIKASQSTLGIDSQFVRNWRETKQLGIIRGAYHYFLPRRSPVNDPKLQAQHFFSVLDNDLGDLPPMLDCESDIDSLSFQEMQDRILKFLAEFKRLSGLECGIYTRKTWWDAQVTNGNKSNTDIPRILLEGMRWLWVAQYNSYISIPTYLPWDWSKRYGNFGWTFWQWSADNNGQGAVYGAESDDIDLNRYNGTKAEFESEFKVDLDGEVDPPPDPTEWLQYKVLVDTLNVRTGPGTKYPDVGDLSEGQMVNALEIGGDNAWIQFEPGKWCCYQLNGTRYLERV